MVIQLVTRCNKVPVWDVNINPFWKWMYQISTAFSLAACVHVLVCIIFINVYGQGLALRGPEGYFFQIDQFIH